MKSRYVDVPAIVNVIGTIYKNPSILDNEEKYFFSLDDFTEKFHKILFGAIYNLHQLGTKEINSRVIEDYLGGKPESLAVYKVNKGDEWLNAATATCQLSTFDYYYDRMKKFTLLRSYNEQAGMDLSWIYDKDNITNIKKKEQQEAWLDNTSLSEIAEIIDNKITDIKMKCVDNVNDDFVDAGEGILELIESLQKVPEIGYPMYGPIVNSITRGARLGKFYLRSAATGVGKTRAMIADACNLACDEIFDSKLNRWVSNGTKEPTLYITTEQEIDEIQTMMLAFLSDVDEDHIIYNQYSAGELERVIYAGEVLDKCPIVIKRLPDFSLKDIENAIKYSVREYNVRYVCFDYIHTSMKILSEVSSKAGVKGLREDNVLFMISVRLKDLCGELGIWIISSTQLNADYISAQQYDQNLLRGAKSIADKIDLGMIMLQTSQEDLEALSPVITKGGFEKPGIKISVYKNRRGRYKDILMWCKAKRGTCKIEPMFVTNYQYELVEIKDLKIEVKERKADKF